MSSAANSPMLTKCCFCGMVKESGHWHDAIEEVAGLYSHGCCPRCEAQMLDEIGLSASPAPAVRRGEGAGWSAGQSRRAARAAAVTAVP